MAGNKLGGLKAAAKTKEMYGDDFYARIGSIGGRKGRTGGFGSHKVGQDGLTGPQRARVAGAVGGTKSRRTKLTVA